MRIIPSCLRFGSPKNTLLTDRGLLGKYVVDVRKRLPPGIDLLNWVRVTTESYAQLFQSSTALILHGNRHQYFINEANFSKGKFLPKNYLGTEDLGWDRFDRLFAHELEINAPVEMLTRAVEVPVKGLYKIGRASCRERVSFGV